MPGAPSGCAGIGTWLSGRNQAMDRERAKGNMAAGLVAAGIAAGIFALSFVVAVLYIAS